MTRFNTYYASRFSGCRLLARARDTSRNRDVALYQIPGEWDVVGVYDGVDVWIAPAAAGPFFKTSTGNVADMLRKLQAGEHIDPPPLEAPRKRERVKMDDDEPAPRPTSRVRVVEEESQPQPRSARRAFV